MKNVVEVKNVVKSFKDKIVLNHVSFSMKPGEIVGFVGQNATGIQGLREELIRLAKEKNVALLISSHQLGEIEKMADRIIGIHFGKIKEISMEEKENVYVLETDRKIPDQSDLQIIEQTGNTYKLEVNSVMEVLSNLEKQGVQVKNITQIHKTLEDVYNEFIQEASL